MKKVLITGGSGAVGEAFIESFYDQYHFISFSRNTEKQLLLKKRFKKVDIHIGSVENKTDFIDSVLKIKPDIIIHAAALKQIDVGEKHPAQAVKVNLIGSLNVIEAAKIADVPITIGISSDKACQSNSVYGHTKNLMERIFLEASNVNNKFACCRLGNVAGSHGSVIPLWLRFVSENQPLKVTDKNMTRFMFLPEDVAAVIQKAIETLKVDPAPFIITKNMKAVNMFDLARSMSPLTEIVGKRPGERVNEYLVASKELPFSYLVEDYIFIRAEKNPFKQNRLQKVINSAFSEKMNAKEIKHFISVMHEKSIN